MTCSWAYRAVLIRTTSLYLLHHFCTHISASICILYFASYRQCLLKLTAACLVLVTSQRTMRKPVYDLSVPPLDDTDMEDTDEEQSSEKSFVVRDKQLQCENGTSTDVALAEVRLQHLTLASNT